MIKIIKILGSFLVLFGVLVPILSFTTERIAEQKYQKVVEEKMENNHYFAILEIEKINLKREIYPLDSKENQVDKNIFVHQDSIFPGSDASYIILAAHSGTGKKAYFQDLYLLGLSDVIRLYYHDKEWIYEIVDIEYQEKTGVLYLKEDYDDMLVLITCTKGNSETQTVYYGVLKDVENL